jgi:hypothetical protein
VHPNTGSRRSTGANRKQLDELARLAERLPANVRLVPADAELSSYTLMAIATVGLVYHSTVALELACKGTTTVVAAGSMVTGLPFVRTVERADDYEAMLDELVTLAPGTVDPEVQRLAWRFAYGRFYRVCVDFPLVRMPDPAGYGELDYNSVEDLAPGREPGLDRCARILLEDEPICVPPSEADLARSDADELEFFGAPSRRFTALAFAEELVADHALLAAWGQTFTDADEATLVIQTPADAVERLIAAVSRAGLDGEGSPDLVAVDADPAELRPIDAVFSRAAQDGPLGEAPRFDETSVVALRAHALGT